MDVVNLVDLNKEIFKEYQQELAFRLTAKGTHLAVRSQAQMLGVVKGFCRYLKAEDFLLADPGNHGATGLITSDISGCVHAYIGVTTRPMTR